MTKLLEPSPPSLESRLCTLISSRTQTLTQMKACPNAILVRLLLVYFPLIFSFHFSRLLVCIASLIDFLRCFSSLFHQHHDAAKHNRNKQAIDIAVLASTSNHLVQEQ